MKTTEFLTAEDAEKRRVTRSFYSCYIPLAAESANIYIYSAALCAKLCGLCGKKVPANI